MIANVWKSDWEWGEKEDTMGNRGNRKRKWGERSSRRSLCHSSRICTPLTPTASPFNKQIRILASTNREENTTRPLNYLWRPTRMRAWVHLFRKDWSAFSCPGYWSSASQVKNALSNGGFWRCTSPGPFPVSVSSGIMQDITHIKARSFQMKSFLRRLSERSVLKVILDSDGLLVEVTHLMYQYACMEGFNKTMNVS